MGTFKGLRLYNTLTRSKEDFAALDDGCVRLYVCGPTVYDDAHIGNARPAIVFDVLFRVLRHVYGADNVIYVRNITDVDDKINARAAKNYPGLALNQAIRMVTEATEAQYHADVSALGCLPPTVEPRATEHVAEMVNMITALIERNHAYVAEKHVLFDVDSWRSDDGSGAYGGLSRRSLDDMIAGARVEVAPYKRSPTDFVLWKPSTAGEPGWESPWGLGRPGWHIECSAMADRWLWQEPLDRLSDAARAHPHVFDIHGGGIDLVFPHHENEIAQSRCAHDSPSMARYWLHNGFLQVEGQKMSKSLGNFTTINDLLKDWPGEVLRLNMLRTHYRQPIDWTLSGLEESRKVLDRWYAIAGDARPGGGDNPMISGPRGVLASLLDDLNTPDTFARLHGFDDDIANDTTGDEHADFKSALNLLGLMQMSREEWQAWRPAGFAVDEEMIRAQITARAEARARKDFATADRIRDELAALRIQLKDSRNPETGELITTWEVRL